MFNGYAGPGWVWPIGRKSFNVVYCGYTKVLRLQNGYTQHHLKKLPCPLWGLISKPRPLGADSLLSEGLVMRGNASKISELGILGREL